QRPSHSHSSASHREPHSFPTRRSSDLGTVTAFNTVTVRSRVDGQIVNVAFKEGQYVHEGDVLVQIDPRPFQVQLEQAEGQLAKRSEEHTSELRHVSISYAVFCLKKKIK